MKRDSNSTQSNGDDAEFSGLSCVRCGSSNIVPIIYGLPTPESMSVFLEADSRGEIRMGGCCVSEGMPTHFCKNCGRGFGHLETSSRVGGETNSECALQHDSNEDRLQTGSQTNAKRVGCVGC
jgi:hypothetical protein